MMLIGYLVDIRGFQWREEATLQARNQDAIKTCEIEEQGVGFCHLEHLILGFVSHFDIRILWLNRGFRSATINPSEKMSESGVTGPAFAILSQRSQPPG